MPTYYSSDCSIPNPKLVPYTNIRMRTLARNGLVLLYRNNNYSNTMKQCVYICDKNKIHWMNSNAPYKSPQLNTPTVTPSIASSISSNIESLSESSRVNVISNNGNKYVLNGGTTYNSEIKYGLTNGTYILKNIPSNHPMAILTQNNSISYTGDDSKKLTKSVNEKSYNFYHGDIIITVSGNFDTASLYCYYHGYMGGENLLVYM